MVHRVKAHKKKDTKGVKSHMRADPLRAKNWTQIFTNDSTQWQHDTNKSKIVIVSHSEPYWFAEAKPAEFSTRIFYSSKHSTYLQAKKAAIRWMRRHPRG